MRGERAGWRGVGLPRSTGLGLCGAAAFLTTLGHGVETPKSAAEPCFGAHVAADHVYHGTRRPASAVLPLHPPPRAYKLGKKRWSYNQVELVLREGGGGGGRTAAVVQAAASGAQFAPHHQASSPGRAPKAPLGL